MARNAADVLNSHDAPAVAHNSGDTHRRRHMESTAAHPLQGSVAENVGGAPVACAEDCSEVYDTAELRPGNTPLTEPLLCVIGKVEFESGYRFCFHRCPHQS